MGKGIEKIRGRRMTDKQERFCLEYMVDHNVSAAARRAGYKALEEGHRMMTKYPLVGKRIEELKAEQQKRLMMSADEVVIALSRIGRFDPRKMYDDLGNLKSPKDWDDDTALCIAGMDVEERRTVDRKDDSDEIRAETIQIRKVKVNDRVQALTVLARRWNLFEQEHKTAAGAIGEALAGIIQRVQKNSGGVAGLINKPRTSK